MLETYYEEIARKRRQRRIFWIVVWLLASFLYLFFQGYYPYVRIDLGQFFESQEEPAKPQVVRAFGIINVRTSPAPDRIVVSSPTIGEKNIPNDDKGFFDFGTYSVKVEKEGYVPVSLEVALDKANSFSISALELFRNPEPAEFPIPVEWAESLGGGKLLVREKAGTGGISASGSVYRVLDSKLSTVSSFRTDARHIGGGYFEKKGAVLAYDETSGLTPVRPKTGSGIVASAVCENAVLVGSDIRCPKTGLSFAPHETSLADRFLGSAGRAVYTEQETLRVENGRVLSVEKVLTLTGSEPGNAVKIAKKTYRLAGGKLSGTAKDAAGFDTAPLSSVASVEEFGAESLILGYANDAVENDTAAFVLVDERGNRYFAKIGKARLSDVRIENFHGAYLVSDGSGVFLYYKGSKELTKLADGKLLALVADGILVDREGKTERIEFVVGEE